MVQILILFNSFLNPINQYQKNIFSFSQNQKEKIYLLSKYCLNYLSKKYNLFINDLIKNENIWNKWKENNCPEISKKVQINNKSENEKTNENINTKINEVKNLFKNYNTNYFMSLNTNFIDNIKTFKETKLEDIKFSESIEGLNSEVPFFGIYLEQIYKDLDPEEEEENTKERILNNMPSFSWKFLRLLSEGDINKINTEQVYKLLNISEEYYKTFAPKDAEIKFNFKVLTPPPKIELKPKEEISLPKDFLEQNNNINDNINNNRIMNLEEAKDETSEEETNKDKPIIRLPTEIIEKEKEKDKEKEKENTNTNDRIIKNLSSDDNIITDLKITPKKEEIKEMIRLPSNLKIVEKNENQKNEEKVFNISNNNIDQICEALPQIKEKEKNNEKNIEKNEINNKINNNANNNNSNATKEIIKAPIKEIEKNKVVIKIDKNEIKNLNITNNNIKLDDGKKNELKSNEKPQIKQSKEENKNNNNIINSKQMSNLNINIKHNNSIHKEKDIVSKDKENNNELNKSIKQQDSTIPAGIINISKDSKNASSINMETKNTKEETKIIPKDSKNNINNTSNKEQHNKNILNNRISNNNSSLKDNNNKINNKINQEIKSENSNNYHNTRSKVFSDRKSPDKKNILNNLSSGNKINSNGNISNRMNSNLSNNRQEINNNNRYDSNKYENKYSNKYDNNKNDNKYDNKYDNKNENNKYNKKYETKYNDKYNNKYDNNKYDYKNDNNYNDRYDNNRYRYDNNYNNNNNHYDNNRYRYDNKSYERNQERDNPYLNKKRYNDDKYDNYMNSNKKRK